MPHFYSLRDLSQPPLPLRRARPYGERHGTGVERIETGRNTSSHDLSTKRQNAEKGFVASKDLGEKMQAVPDGRSDTVAATTTLPEYPQGEIDTSETVDLITVLLEGTVATLREVHDAVDDEDPTSADILHAVIEKLEQFAW